MTDPDDSTPTTPASDQRAADRPAPDQPGPADPTPQATRIRRVASKLGRSRIVFVAWVAAVTLLAVPLLFHAEAKLGPGKFSATVSPALNGTTRVGVPPLGSLSAKTHSAPVRLGFELREVDFLDAIDPDNQPGIEGIEREVRDDIPGALIHLGLVLAGTSVLVGIAAAALFPGRRSWARVATGATLAPILITALVAPAAWGYDVDQLEKNPELNGPLGSSEMLFAKVGSLDTRFGTVSSRTEVLAAKITGLYSAATTNEIARSDGEVALLHVSDLHLNSVGLALARDLATRFDVDAVIDTGDITSFGFEPEAGFVEILDGFPMPYYVIAGNHDSESVRRQLARSDAVTYLDGDTAQVGDVKILGIGDPTVTALRNIPKDEINRTYREQFAATKRLVAQDKPDLVMVHNPVQLRPILGKVPAAAAGHLHQTKLEVIDGTVVALVGSSGATGLGNLLVEKNEPYRFELLRFIEGDLVAVDEISLDGASGDFTLKRRLITSDEADTTDQIPQSDVVEPSREQVERDDPEALDAATSTTASDTEIPGLGEAPMTTDTTTTLATTTTEGP